MVRKNRFSWFVSHLELADHLVDERDEVMELLGIWSLQQVSHGVREEGEDALVEAHHHTMQELAYSGVEQLSVHRSGQHLYEQVQHVHVRLHTPARHPRLRGRESLARSAANIGS